MSLNIAVDGDNSSSCAFAGATAGSGVSLGVRGCESSSGGGSPNGWSGKSVPPTSQAVTSLPSSAVVAPNNVSVASTGQLPNPSLGSWNMNPPPTNSNNNSHFASTSIQSQQQQTQQQANVSNGSSAMTATPTIISGDIIVDSQDNEAWPSITSMTSTTTTTTTGNNSNVSVSKLNINNPTTSVASTASPGQVAGGTSGVLMLHPSSGSSESNSALGSSDVWGTSSNSTGSAWGGPFAQPPTVTSSSSLASLWGGSTSSVGAITDPNYSPWGTSNSVMPQNGSSLWNTGGATATPNAESTATSNEWSSSQLQSQNQQQTPQPQTSQPQQVQASQSHLHRSQPQPVQLQPQSTTQSQQAAVPQSQQQPQPEPPQQQQLMALQQPPPPLSQLQPLPPHSQTSTQAQSPTWGAGSGPPNTAGWLPSAAPSSRATPTNEVAAINAQSATEEGNQTWAQAAGKGVSVTTTPIPESSSSGMKSPEDLIRDEAERQVWALINTNEIWGKRPVNQGTPWDCGLTKEDHMKHIDSNVWMNEPPNGTGQWEHHYESLGEKTARWSVLNKGGSSASGGTAGIDMRPPGAAHQWGRSTSVSAEGGDGPFWNTQTQSWERGQRNAPPSRLHSVSGLPSGASGATWCADEWASTASHRSSVGDTTDWSRGNEQWIGSSGATTPTNPSGPGMRWGQQGPDDSSNMWSSQGSQSGSGRGSIHGDDFSRRMPMSNNSGGNRSGMRAHVLRRLMDMGFRKEDAQQALISHNMNFDRAVQELQNKRMQGLSGSGDGNFVAPQANSSMLSRNQAMPPPSMNMHNPQHSQQQSLQQNQSMQQVHQQQPQQQQQQQPPHQLQQQQQQQQQQQPHHHQQQQLMRQQIMTQVQASVQNKMQGGNGNGSGGSGVQPNGSGGSGGPSGNFSNSNAIFQLQQQIQQIRQQLTILHSRSKALHTQYMQYNSSGNMPAARNVQQQLEQITNELQGLSKNHQLMSMRLTQLQNSAQQPQSQHQQQQAYQQQQQHGPTSQPHMGSNMMNQQQMNPEHRQYMNQMNDMIERMGNMMPPSNGMTGNHATGGVWKSSDQSAPGPWYNLPVTGDEQRSPHGPAQNMNAAPQVSNLSMDIPEFIPGKPWQGITPKDDPNMTVGSRKVIFNMLNNDHLEKLSVKDSRGPQSPGNPYGSGHRRHHVYNGPSPMYQQYSSGWILIRNMPSNVTLDLIKMFVGQHGPVVTIQPNVNAGWVLIRYVNAEDAVKAQKSLVNHHFGQVESITESEAQRLQQEIQALAARFNPNTAWSNTNHFGGIGSGDGLLPEAHLIPGDL